jgi:hypothetical protein
MVSKNKKTHIKQIRQGLSIYKTGNSPFWSARIWIGSERRYVVRSTKETARLDALEVAEEIFAVYGGPLDSPQNRVLVHSLCERALMC